MKPVKISRGLLVVLVIAAGALSSVSVSAEDESETDNSNLFGIASHAWWLDPEVVGDQLFPALDDLDVTTVRIGIDWKRFEREPGVYDWDKYDRVFSELERHDIEIIANFNTIPYWASANQIGCAIEEQEPTHCQLRDDMRGAFQDAMYAALERYSWIENWEFWNEPEMWEHFRGLTYLEHLWTFYHAAEDVNPEITVAASTLVGPEYMEWLYNTSDAWYGPGNEPWDAVAYHPYNEHGAGFADPDVEPIRYDRVIELRELMVERSGPEMMMWITEYGWYGDPREQAENLVEVLDWMRQQPFIEFAHLHMLHDWHETDEHEHYGLMAIVPDEDGETVLDPGTEFEPKPHVYEAFRDYPRESTWPAPRNEVLRIFPVTGHSIYQLFRGYWEEQGASRITGPALMRSRM